jgi:putative ABC transport system permease protein
VTIEQFKDAQTDSIKSLLNVLYVLLALSVVVSLFGIVNTLVLTVFERIRGVPARDSRRLGRGARAPTRLRTRTH